MYIKSIELNNFRNYENIRVSFNNKINIFLGNNAQGKTNLLEGIYLNAMARSFKTTKDKELIRFGQEYCKIKTSVIVDDDEQITEIVINSEGKKAVKIDGVKIKKTSELLERVLIIIFSPEDLKIVKDEPEKRRKFIDRELCQIKTGYYNDISNYKKVLKQRNTYLKENVIENSVLDIWDYELAKYGSRIIWIRKKFIKKIDKISREIHDKISGGRENLSLKYEANIKPSKSPEEMEADFYEILKESRGDDIRNKNTGRGPHKDDMKISADQIDLRKFGSQGQQRTAALSIKLSEIKLIEDETGENPILLLDDVLSELDNDRQRYLLNSLGKNQMFITTADISGNVIKSIAEGKVYKIVSGEIDIEI
ncbi:MAG: DNA replication/repair protein RecF [Clostridiales bacterium]|nr:DNA replication/repair protein RecF [Clostridiales bacterium]